MEKFNKKKNITSELTKERVMLQEVFFFECLKTKLLAKITPMRNASVEGRGSKGLVAHSHKLFAIR